MDQFVAESSVLPIAPVGARFVLLSDQPSRIVRAGTEKPLKRVTWRLVAANNRSIARASGMFGSVTECAQDIAELSAQLDQAVASVSFQPGTEASTASHWSWTVQLADRPVAVSIHRYQRRIECERALRYFLDAVRVTPPAPDSVRRLGEWLGA